MLSIATLFDDEQRLLNRVWIVLLGLEALLVLFGTVSAIVRGVVALRRRRPGGLRRAGSNYGRPRRVTIELPATAFEYEYDDRPNMDLNMDTARTMDYDYHDYDDVDYANEKVHTPTRARTPTRIFSSPSSKV
ncbi:hypothetical protein SEUCBS139899_009382 [Sporothrix eucalyptigena]|uniref:Integral membrane protein n=1 Tax=Sporothrix eucalyptigena TaxID=1812306 RepID=A0ABP0D2S8_9PEZI